MEGCVQLWGTQQIGKREGDGPGGVSPQEAQEDDQRAGVHLFYRKAERDESVQRGEEKVLGRSSRTFQCTKGAYKKSGEGLLTRLCSYRTWANGFKLKKGRIN